MMLPLEERLALQDLMVDYCYAVDNLADLAPLLDLFTPDAVLDFSHIGLSVMRGRGEWEPFFANVFAGMSHHTHYISNFRVESYSGEQAVMRAYVQGFGRAKDGNSVHVHVRYRMECVKVAGVWKCSRYDNLPGMPMPGSLAEIHADH